MDRRTSPPAPRPGALGALALALLPAWAGPLVAATPAQEPVLDDALRRAWARLDAGMKEEVVQFLRAETDRLETYQMDLVRAVLNQAAIDRAAVAPWVSRGAFDPLTHAPKQPIARRILPPDDRRARAAREELLPPEDPREIACGWAWDWSVGELRRVEGDETARVFENALRGHPPDLDLARAIVIGRLDRGEERTALLAFSHAYADREGNVYPGVTLYDAWNSGRTIEMPDVDTLGIVHTVLDEWRKWKAPVPASKHDSLYAEVEELFQDAHRYRALREALAEAYLVGTPPARDGYGPNLVRFHALWLEHEGSVEALAEELPDADGWEKYLKAWVAKCNRDPDRVEEARTRQGWLDEGGRRVRACLEFVMRELGTLDGVR